MAIRIDNDIDDDDVFPGDGLGPDLLLDADFAHWVAAEEEASARYQAMLRAKRRAGQLKASGSPLAAKALVTLAELETAEAARAVPLRFRALRALAELGDLPL